MLNRARLVVGAAMLALMARLRCGAGRGRRAAAPELDVLRLARAASRSARTRATYKEHGINLDIRSGNGSGSAHRLVANGDSDFSYGSCASMINLAAEGAPLVSVGVIDAMGTEAIIVRPDAGREGDRRPEGQDAAHHRQCRREHLLPAGAEECRARRSRT